LLGEPACRKKKGEPPPILLAGSLGFFAVPTLTRLILVLALLGAAGYGIVFSLANFVHPSEREITVRVQKDGFAR